MPSTFRLFNWDGLSIESISRRTHGLRRRGFIDLVVAAPLRVGIELDHTAPRKKSLLKLREFDGLKVIVLRNGWGNTAHRGDVVIIGCGGSGTTHFTR
jgi:hypothetical protein